MKNSFPLPELLVNQAKYSEFKSIREVFSWINEVDEYLIFDFMFREREDIIQMLEKADPKELLAIVKEFDQFVFYSLIFRQKNVKEYLLTMKALTLIESVFETDNCELAFEFGQFYENQEIALPSIKTKGYRIEIMDCGPQGISQWSKIETYLVFSNIDKMIDLAKKMNSNTIWAIVFRRDDIPRNKLLEYLESINNPNLWNIILVWDKFELEYCMEYLKKTEDIEIIIAVLSSRKDISFKDSIEFISKYVKSIEYKNEVLARIFESKIEAPDFNEYIEFLKQQKNKSGFTKRILRKYENFLENEKYWDQN